MVKQQTRYQRYKESYLAYKETHEEENKKYAIKYYADYRDRQYFNGNRKIILERDNYMCQLCGMTDREHREKWGLSITIDHKDGQGINSMIKNHALDNLWVLCLPCHGRKDKGKALEGLNR